MINKDNSRMVEDKFKGQGLLNNFNKEAEEVENIMIRKLLSIFYHLSFSKPN